MTHTLVISDRWRPAVTAQRLGDGRVLIRTPGTPTLIFRRDEIDRLARFARNEATLQRYLIAPEKHPADPRGRKDKLNANSLAQGGVLQYRSPVDNPDPSSPKASEPSEPPAGPSQAGTQDHSSARQQAPPTSVTISAAETIDSDRTPPKFEVKLGKEESPWKDRIAAISVVATVIVSIAGMFAAWIAGTRHDERQLQEAQASFTQTQQRDAYAAFYSAVNEYVEAVWAEERQFEPFDNRVAVTAWPPP